MGGLGCFLRILELNARYHIVFMGASFTKRILPEQ